MTRRNPTIKVTSKTFSKHPVLRSRLVELFPSAQFNEDGRDLGSAALIDFLSDADGALVGLEPMTRAVIDKLPNLKLIAKYGVGLDNVDIDYARQKGITIGWEGGVNKRSVAELTLAFMVGLSRNVFRSGYALKGGVWNKAGGVQLSGKTVALIGFGHVGTEVAKLLRPFECQLFINDIVDKTQEARTFGARQASFAESLSRADIVSLHVPLTAHTKGMINASTIRQMKSTAYLINTARGPIVHQEDLARALQDGVIAGAALDVFAEEPPTDLALLKRDNLMVTPHIGGNAEEAVLAMGTAAINKLQEFFLGK